MERKTLTESFFDRDSGTLTHLIVDQATKHCAIIDPVLNFDPFACRISTEGVDEIIQFIQDHDLSLQWLLETHIHADHISASHHLKQKLGGQTGMGTGIIEVLKHWIPVFGTEADTGIEGEQFDHLFADQEVIALGESHITVLHTPGHTPACVTYQVNDSELYVGDTLFAPNRGTARVDFPGGDATTLYQSIQGLYQNPDQTVVYLCHDYPDDDAAPVVYTTIGEQKQHNIMLNQQTSLDSFIHNRTQRDKTLAVPKLILPSIQTNMRLGALGAAAENGIHYLKLPINAL